ncbi:MFS transporter [Nocardia pseudobrasiliensis]
MCIVHIIASTVREIRVDRGRSGTGIVGVLALAGITAAVTQTLVVPLLGELPQLLHTSAANASWVVTATLLAGAVTTPMAGRLGDLYGKRRLLLISAVPLIVGSVVCALAGSLLPMLIGRGLQGMGMGIVPLGISALRDVLPAERLGSSIALLSASLGIGGALGLPIAAAVAQHSNWRVLFWATAVLSVAVAVAIWAVVPPTVVAAKGRFDPLGALGLGVALVCLLLGVSKGATWGWGSASIIGLFVAAVVVALVWGWWELRCSDPLVDLRVTARPQVLLTNAASLATGFAMYSASLILPQLLQLPTITGYGLGQSMLAMGLWMAPGGLVMMLVSPVGARLSAATTPKVTLSVGALVIALGYGASALLMGSTWGLLIAVCIINGGVGLAYGAMPALIMGAVPLSETASANSFNTLMRSIGTSVSAAVIGAVLAQMSTSLGGHSIPTESGFRTGLLIGSGIAVVAALIATTIPVRRAVPAVADQKDSPEGLVSVRD